MPDERGVRVRMLTNSLASNDVPAVTAKYKKYRKPLLEAGVELYEFRSDAEIQPGIVDSLPRRRRSLPASTPRQRSSTASTFISAPST